jgi:hypothetical protein
VKEEYLICFRKISSHFKNGRKSQNNLFNIIFWDLKQKPAAGAAGFRGGCG